MKVIYPVLFYEEDDEQYSIFVPDLENSTTCGKNLEEAMTMAEELIALNVLNGMEKNDKIPTSSKIENVSFSKLEKELDIKNWNYKSRFKTYISADIDKYAERWNKKKVKKTVNIPQWINVKAEALNINFSRTLEQALIEKIYK